MEITLLKQSFSICKVRDYTLVDWDAPYIFLAKTDEENSLVCPTAQAPTNLIAQEKEWRGFRIQGMLDFSLIGILARITTLLADQKISIFAISTYDTDYIFVKEENLEKTLHTLKKHNYHVLEGLV